MKVFNNNFVCAMHGFQDNEDLLQSGSDVIRISPPRGASPTFFMTDSDKETLTSCDNLLSAMHGF